MEKLSGQTSAENENATRENSSKAHNIEEVPNTPFVLVHSEQGVFAAIGNHRVTEPFETKEQLESWMNNNQWHITLQLIIIVVERFHEFKKFQENDVNLSAQ